MLRYAAPGRGDRTQDTAVIEAVRGEFPATLSTRPHDADLPPNRPHVVLASETAQFSLGFAQSEVLVQFGDMGQDPTEAMQAAETKVMAALRGLDAAEIQTAGAGVIAVSQLSAASMSGFDAARHIHQHQQRIETDESRIQDAFVRIGLRVADTYFVNLQLMNYETRQLLQPVVGGGVAIALSPQPWQGTVVDEGLQLLVDVNTFLEARRTGAGAPVTEERLRTVIGLVRLALTDLADGYIATGVLPVEPLDGVVEH